MMGDKSIVSELIDSAVESEASGDYENAIAYAKEAVRLSEGMGLLYWTARYNYHIFRIHYDETVHFNSEYRELLRLRKEAVRDREILGRLINDDGVDILYIKLLFFIVILRYKDCEKVPEYDEIAKSYQYIVEQYGIDYFEGISHYKVSNMCLAHFYISEGNSLAAICYYEKILDRVDEDGQIDQLTFQALVSLGFAYLETGEAVKARKLSKFLYDGYHTGKLIDPLQTDLQRLVVVYINSYTLKQIIGPARGIIAESLDSGMLFHAEKDDYMCEIYIALLEFSQILNQKIAPSFIRDIRFLFKEKEGSGELEKLPRSDRALFYYGKAILSEQMDDEGSALRYMDKAVSEYLSGIVLEQERMNYAAFMSISLEFYAKYSASKAGECAEHIMKQLARLYSGAEYLLDNVRMEEHMAVCDRIFYLAYSYFSSEPDRAEDLFVYSANYKNVLLSAVRGRTKKIYHDRYNLSLIEKINEVRDKIASGKNRNSGRDSAHVKALTDELKELEMAFAALHHKNEQIPFFSFERIMTVLPKSTVLIEMIYTDHESWKRGRTESFTGAGQKYKKCLDIFVLLKNNTVTFRHICIKDIDYLERQIQILLEKIMSPKAKYQKEAQNICETMFGGFRELFFDITDVIISPHGRLYNVPFELIFESAWDEIKEKRFIYCQSVRDLFEHDFGVREVYGESCVAGSPKYHLTVPNARKILSIRDREAKESGFFADGISRLYDIRQITSLPYSQYEAKKVARLLGGSCLTGEVATKYLIKPGYSVIHIATHGLIKQIGERNAWYNSALAFSGIVDWYVSGNETEGYGNGLLTAEEISRLDLGETNLAVLSACNSGTSSFTLYEQQSGLHLAFGVAGVKYVISALWQVDDFAAAVLMIFFYQILLDCRNVPEALAGAKLRLRNMTAGELYWMIQDDKDLISEELYQKLSSYFAEVPEGTLLYRSPRYYASFVCYQYKF